MLKKIIKIGSSLGLTLSSEQLRQLGLKRGDEVEMTFNKKRGVLEIEPLVSGVDLSVNEPFLRQIDGLARKHREELKSLDSEW